MNGAPTRWIGASQAVERFGLQLRGELGAEPADADRLVRDDRAARAPDRLGERLEVERQQRARVDHLGLDPLGGQPLGRGQRLADHPRERDDRQSRPPRSGGRDRVATGCGSTSSGFAPEVQRLVLDEHDRVRIGDRARQQARRVGRAGRHHDLQPGDVREPRLEALRVLRARRAAGAALGAQHDRGTSAGRRT